MQWWPWPPSWIRNERQMLRITNWEMENYWVLENMAEQSNLPTSTLTVRWNNKHLTSWSTTTQKCHSQNGVVPWTIGYWSMLSTEIENAYEHLPQFDGVILCLLNPIIKMFLNSCLFISSSVNSFYCILQRYQLMIYWNLEEKLSGYWSHIVWEALLEARFQQTMGMTCRPNLAQYLFL